MPFFQSFDNQSIYYHYHRGSVPFLLFFLHGWTASSDFMRPYKKFFQKDYHFVFWDARCHGKSDAPKNAVVQDIAKDLYFFLHNIHDKRMPVIAIGHSMGALTLFEYIDHYGTDDFYKLVIIDQSPKLMTDETWELGIYGNYTPEINQKMVEAFKKDLGEGVIKLSTSGLNTEYNKLFEKHPEFFYQRKRVFRPEQIDGLIHIWQSLVQADYRKTIEKIDIPTLLLYGLKSQYYKKETALYLKERIKKSTLHFFEEGDHSPFMSYPDEFAKVIEDFIENA